MAQANVDQLIIEVLGTPPVMPEGAPATLPRTFEFFPFDGIPRGVNVTAIGGIASNVPTDGTTTVDVSFAAPFSNYCYWVGPVYIPQPGDVSPIVAPIVTALTANGFTMTAVLVSGTIANPMAAFTYGAIGI